MRSSWNPSRVSPALLWCVCEFTVKVGKRRRRRGGAGLLLPRKRKRFCQSSRTVTILPLGNQEEYQQTALTTNSPPPFGYATHEKIYTGKISSLCFEGISFGRCDDPGRRMSERVERKARKRKGFATAHRRDGRSEFHHPGNHTRVSTLHDRSAALNRTHP